MDSDAEASAVQITARLLNRIGLKPGLSVLDFGCHKGNYTKAAARIVGPEGTVYAVDKDCGILDELRPAVAAAGSSKVEFLCISEQGDIPLPCHCVDIALLYDVLHRGYFPEEAQRRHVLEHIRRVLRPDGILSFYPTHLKSFGTTFATLIREVEAAGFALCGESRKRLVHDGKIVRGKVFSFRPAADS
jgi:ubiquinone/menaquinone biosynthesis C-methylase UbiE